MSKKKRGPVVIEVDGKKPVASQAKTKTKKPKTVAAPATISSPAEAPPVPELLSDSYGSTMHTVTALAARKPSRIWRVFWSVLLALVGMAISIAFWDFITGLLDRNIWLGRAALALIIILILCAVFLMLRELRAFARLRRIDALRADADDVLAGGTLEDARAFTTRIERLYRQRKDLGWALAEFKKHSNDQLDATALMSFTDHTLLTPLDKTATEIIERASRQVATGTAIVPLALADVVIALTANIRMIRQIAETYGGKAGSFGSWRLMKAVAAHLVATGAVAIGDDMLGSIAGGSVLSKLSRRFGEGIVNGALTARVGIAAMEVCRPMPLSKSTRPSVTSLLKRAMTGFFNQS